ncbi:hypothetical protein L873DRAFT_1744025 [Choiromyces venosus 120613-1]|uniref:Restriction endonuclease domain-containing protein n=1 Tax=Choiromyces venosus 120613-1 TaxID=1336337 RepID=A0A3N4JH23_9PEZI|nr:hypothetical protein L873DRAFT_1744025 [Choiromyces venosus 120613-1]
MAAVPAPHVRVSPTPTAPQPPDPSGPLDMHYYLTEGLEGVEHQEYRDMRSFTRAIDSQAAESGAGNADEYPCPYMVFSPVTRDQLANIERVRDTRYKRLRFMYLNDPKALIIKIMPSVPHELVTGTFVSAFLEMVAAMGLRRALASVGHATYQGLASRKEADGSFKPRLARPLATDWPTVVLECGVSESARRLKVDARWWLDNSLGEVKIVLVFYVLRPARTIRIEHWEMDTMPNPQVTRAHPHPVVTRPIIRDTIHIDGNAVTGGPLRLNFQKIFLRAPVAAQGEGHFTFTAQDLRDYYHDVWTAAL